MLHSKQMTESHLNPGLLILAAALCPLANRSPNCKCSFLAGHSGVRCVTSHWNGNHRLLGELGHVSLDPREALRVAEQKIYVSECC